MCSVRRFCILGSARPVALNAVLLCALLGCLVLPGCVSTGFDFTTTEDIEAARDVPDPATGTVVHYAARQKTTHRRGRYLNNQALGQAAGIVGGGLMDQFGGIGGIVANIGTGGWLGIGTAALGLLGIGGKAVHSLGTAKGKDIGWDDREKAAAVQAPLPGTVTATASTSTGVST